MRLEWIEDILAVLDSGSFAAAAERRFLTQSAFTRRLRTIETTLGSDLFDRSKKPARLLPHVCKQEQELRALTAQLRKLRNSLTDKEEILGKRIVLACQHTVAATIAPRLIRQITEDGTANVKVRASDKNACLAMLLTSEADLVLSYETEEEANASEGLPFEKMPLGQDLIIPVYAPMAGPHLSGLLDDFILPLIAYPPDIFLGQVVNRDVLSHLNAQYRIEVKAESGLALAVMHYVLEGIGVGWLPQSLAQPHLDSAALVRLDDRFPECRVQLILFRRYGRPSAKTQSVWDTIGRHSARKPSPRAVESSG